MELMKWAVKRFPTFLKVLNRDLGKELRTSVVGGRVPIAKMSLALQILTSPRLVFIAVAFSSSLMIFSTIQFVASFVSQPLP